MTDKLPKDFFWGNSTSSMQTEGAWNVDGKGLSVYDLKPATKETSDWHDGIDAYHNYEQDINLMANQGMNFYRFQISWSRVDPNGDGNFNEAGIAFYDRLINALLKRNIKPMICLYHFDMPLALAKKYNGFLSRPVVSAFVRYGIEMVKRFGDRVKYWVTFNEQNLYHTSEVFNISGYLTGDKTVNEMYQISHHVMLAHAGVANYIHEQTDCLVGGMLAYSEVYPATANPKDILYARQIDEFLNRNLLDAFVYGRYSNEVMNYVRNHKIEMDYQLNDDETLIKVTSDFIAFSYYRSDTVDSTEVPAGTVPNQYLDFGLKRNPYLQTSEFGWQIDPLGFRDVLTKVYNQYCVPMFPIENGIGFREEYTGKEIQDDYRIDYMRNHIQAMKEAILEDGVEVLGYLGWGLIDIPSSSGNMDKRYGTVYVNRTNHDLKDLKRIPKKSYWWLQRVIKSNGESLE
ncbi:Beta-glucosidase 6-phospho-beta-glucosidase beta-galactosidase [Companilactobacillus mindensis DSM 14500]|uniref:Beta-glucosidase 6-phospho-beta-glucosidase beta-galactosidase n=1 Tax=Companilactobacillus mindensis DSM 14500 TaxID=1423770 RepID=A0A0R1QNK7_9LACO|nr:glycoside hydrolase family 1 protein [Companilactobacillus mindensis]KRL42667.1 Beta-glucosidase 6-phospho-beta-glucosidase beta-galactosidase [Companilactobacillus mindensis DSM 14500]GEO79568.1 6-phospho-beta-glucosidase [Companilactobacillus mindensis]